jgi:hypothetical protein
MTTSSTKHGITDLKVSANVREVRQCASMPPPSYARRRTPHRSPAQRLEVRALRISHGLVAPFSPFANLPEARSGRWGQGLTKAKMAECQWLKPELVGQFEFLEWTGDNHLRHSKFVGLREDKKARDVVRE